MGSSGYSSNSSTSGVHEPVFIQNTTPSPLSGGSSGPLRRITTTTPRNSKISNQSLYSDNRCFTGCRKDGSFKSIDRNSSLRARFQTELNSVVKKSGDRGNNSPINSIDSGHSDSYSNNGITNHVIDLNDEHEFTVSSKV